MRPVLRAFYFLENSDKRKFLSLVILRIFAQTLDLLGLALVGVIGTLLAVDLDATNNSQFLGFDIGLYSSEQVLWLIVATVGFFLAKSALSSFLLSVTTRFLARVEAEAATGMARHIFSGGLRRLKSIPEGERVWLGVPGTNVALSGMLFAGATVVSEGSLFLVVLMAFLAIDLVTTGIVAGYFVLVVIVFQLVISRRLKTLGAQLASTSIATNDSILSVSGAYREITVGGTLAFYLEGFRRFRSRYASEMALQRFVMGLPRFIIEAALMVGFLVLVLWQFQKGGLGNGIAVTAVFLAGGLRLMAAMLPLQNALSEVRIRGEEAIKALELLSLVQEFKSEETINKEPAKGNRLLEPASVQFKNLSLAFPGSDQNVLSALTFSVTPGNLVAIVGPSGAGKTTLADVLLGLYEPDSGAVLIDGLSPRSYLTLNRGGLSYVPQRPGIVQGSLAQNIALGLDDSKIDYERIEDVLRLANLADLAHSLPEGVRTNLWAGEVSLSGGQVQRLGIARALYSRPALLVLDEATSALDAETEDTVTSSIRALAGSMTIVVIAHRLSTVQHADSVLVLEDGTLIAQGSFQEVREQVPLIERYVELMNVGPLP